MIAPTSIVQASSLCAFDEMTARISASFDDAAKQVQPAHWLFEVGTRGGRSQLVHLLLRERENGASRLVLYSPIGPLPRRFDAEGLLRLNAQLLEATICIGEGVGAWRWNRPYLMLRTSRLARSAEWMATRALIEHVGHAADRLEKEVFGWDRC